MIVAFTGMPGSGKSEAARIAHELGFKIFRMGDLVEAMARDKGLSVGEVADSERKRYGNGIWAKRTLELLGGESAAIDGLRGRSELDVFRGGCELDFRLIAIWASPSTRRQRLIRRRRDDMEELEKRDARELSWGLGDSIALADFMIINEGRLEDFKGEVAGLLSSLIGSA